MCFGGQAQPRRKPAFEPETRAFLLQIRATEGSNQVRQWLLKDSIRLSRKVYSCRGSRHKRWFFRDCRKRCKRWIYNEENAGGKWIRTDSLHFSKAECRAIFRSLRRRRQLFWPESFLNNVRLFTPTREDCYCAKALPWLQFSAPVFLRDNTLAAFAWRVIDCEGGDGYECFTLFQKGVKGWESFAVLYDGEGVILP